MKNKTLKTINRLLLVSIFIASACNQPHKKPISQEERKGFNADLIPLFNKIESIYESHKGDTFLEDNFKQQMEVVAEKVGYPVECPQYLYLKGYRSFFVHASPGGSPFKIGDNEINLDDFVNYYFHFSASDIEKGIRISYGVINDSIVSILSVASGSQRNDDMGYYMLRKKDYSSKGWFWTASTVMTPPALVQQAKDDYYQQVWIDGKQQTRPGAIFKPRTDTFRQSRFYSWEDINHLIAQSLTSSGDPYENHHIKIEHGYCNYRLAKDIFPRINYEYPRTTKDSILIGHTSILTITPYQSQWTCRDLYHSGDPLNWLNTPLEIGRPCPPYCPPPPPK